MAATVVGAAGRGLEHLCSGGDVGSGSSNDKAWAAAAAAASATVGLYKLRAVEIRSLKAPPGFNP